ncbi:MAG TPA: sulfotransferase, partial [Acetobacteraceae bacterium]|nr:sulfotransferase [Acetobacteraceae bacterium]
ELGRYYRAYSDLMEHWRQVLPANAVLDVRYEDLVADLEGQSRRLLDYCEIPWNDACLAFHRNRRPVRTASATQVRQPLYANSVSRWHAFGDLAQPLLQALNGEVRKA